MPGFVLLFEQSPALPPTPSFSAKASIVVFNLCHFSSCPSLCMALCGGGNKLLNSVVPSLLHAAAFPSPRVVAGGGCVTFCRGGLGLLCIDVVTSASLQLCFVHQNSKPSWILSLAINGWAWCLPTHTHTPRISPSFQISPPPLFFLQPSEIIALMMSSYLFVTLLPALGDKLIYV